MYVRIVVCTYSLGGLKSVVHCVLHVGHLEVGGADLGLLGAVGVGSCIEGVRCQGRSLTLLLL